MVEVNIYELSKTLWIKAFPKLIETAYTREGKVLVYCKDEESVASIDNVLWTYEQLSFLPHVTTNDEYVKDTPILISNSAEPLNGAEVLALASLQLPEKYEGFTKILVMYNKNDKDEKGKVDTIYEKFNDLNFKINKFVQNLNGSWEKN